jgi:hypothetical protein
MTDGFGDCEHKLAHRRQVIAELHGECVAGRRQDLRTSSA